MSSSLTAYPAYLAQSTSASPWKSFRETWTFCSILVLGWKRNMKETQTEMNRFLNKFQILMRFWYWILTQLLIQNSSQWCISRWDNSQLCSGKKKKEFMLASVFFYYLGLSDTKLYLLKYSWEICACLYVYLDTVVDFLLILAPSKWKQP